MRGYAALRSNIHKPLAKWLVTLAALLIGLAVGVNLGQRSRYPFTQTDESFFSRVMSDGSEGVDPLIDGRGNWFWIDERLNLVVVVLEGPKGGMVGPILTRRGAALFRVGEYAEKRFVKVAAQRDCVVLIKQDGRQISLPAKSGATDMIKQIHEVQNRDSSGGSLVESALEIIAPDYGRVWKAFLTNS